MRQKRQDQGGRRPKLYAPIAQGDVCEAIGNIIEQARAAAWGDRYVIRIVHRRVVAEKLPKRWV